MCVGRVALTPLADLPCGTRRLTRMYECGTVVTTQAFCAGKASFDATSIEELTAIQTRFDAFSRETLASDSGGVDVDVQETVVTANTSSPGVTAQQEAAPSPETLSKYGEKCGTYDGWCEAVLYCDETSWLRSNKCLRCPCSGHGEYLGRAGGTPKHMMFIARGAVTLCMRCVMHAGSCGRGTNEGAPQACVCQPDHYGTTCNAHCSSTDTCTLVSSGGVSVQLDKTD